MAREAPSGIPANVNAELIQVSMQEAVSQSLFAYWNGLRDNRPAPKRFEIDPSRIANHLPNTFILERHDAGDLRFRLAGTRIADALGVELRGTNLFDLFNSEDARALQDRTDVIAEQCAVGVFRMSAVNPEGRSASFEMLILPLVHTQDTVDRFLGSIVPLDKPDWLGTSVLTNRALTDHLLVWPDRALGVTHSDRQLPFQPIRREARIVRSARRQFRVYDGGLCQAEER